VNPASTPPGFRQELSRERANQPGPLFPQSPGIIMGRLSLPCGFPGCSALTCRHARPESGCQDDPETPSHRLISRHLAATQNFNSGASPDASPVRSRRFDTAFRSPASMYRYRSTGAGSKLPTCIFISQPPLPQARLHRPPALSPVTRSGDVRRPLRAALLSLRLPCSATDPSLPFGACTPRDQSARTGSEQEACLPNRPFVLRSPEQPSFNRWLP
jgi:hypothetical protein